MHTLTRRKFLAQAQAGAAAILAASAPAAVGRSASGIRAGLTPAAEIEERVRRARPLRGGRIPRDLASRLGATHYDGRYHLTEKPYLIEGAEAIYRLGMRCAKFWLSATDLPGYGYHSDWDFTRGQSLAAMLAHPYFSEALAIQFSTVVLEVMPVTRTPKGYFEPDTDFSREEQEFHDIAAHLLKTYAKRRVTFILQHWEGDWMLRGSTSRPWPGTLSTQAVDERCEGFARWLAARQRGVERARKAATAGRCRVYHAAEVNRVWDGVKGLPTLTTHVLPRVAVDLVSWSSYDGMNSAVETWQGVELIRKHMRASSAFGKPTIYIGEIGKPEQDTKPEQIIDWWDRAMGVFLALDLPWILHWELYCNEPKKGDKADYRPRQAEELRGFWLVRPDGTLGHAARYLTRLLEHAGKRLPDTPDL